MTFVKKSSFIALFYVLIATLLGVVLRLFPITDINATFKFLVHTHSHIALLGWVYVALTTLLYHIGIDEVSKKKHALIFWSTQVTIVGMLVTFPFVGYAIYSIIFSTLFILCSYWFFFFFKKRNNLNRDTISYKFIQTSLLLMVLSSIGPWALGAIMNTLGNTSYWYHNAIYFYLHFQYNGWFLFCLLGIFFFILEKQGVVFSNNRAKLFYHLLLVSCLLTLFLSFLWIQPVDFVYFLSGIGAIVQVFALYMFAKILIQSKNKLKELFSKFFINVLKGVVLLFAIKILLQLLTAFPSFVVLTTEITDFVIAYLHLVFLGIITPVILVFLHQFKLISLSKVATILFLVGFIFSEILIIYKGIAIWKQQFIPEYYYEYLVICSAFMPLGILGVVIQNRWAIFPTQTKSL